MIPEGMTIGVTRIDFPQNPEVLHIGYFFSSPLVSFFKIKAVVQLCRENSQRIKLKFYSKKKKKKG